MNIDWSILLNILLVVGFILDRVLRLQSTKEYREAKEEIVKAKEATILLLKEKVEFLEKHNDEFIAEKLKKSVDRLKEIVNDKEEEISRNEAQIIAIQDKLNAAASEKDGIRHNNENMQMEISALERQSAVLTAEVDDLNSTIQNHSENVALINQKLTFYLSNKLRVSTSGILGLLSVYKENLMSAEECLAHIQTITQHLEDNTLEMTRMIIDFESGTTPPQHDDSTEVE